MVLTDTEPVSPSADASRPGEEARRSLSRGEAVVVALVVVMGVVLRFWTRSHLWLDEALSVDIARLPLGEIGSALRQDGHPPLYYYLLHEWMLVFGQGDNAVRALSELFAVATLPLGWLAGRRAGGPRAGWAFVVLLSLSPFAIRYATETRMYSLVMVLVLVGYLLLRNALERPSAVRLVGIALVTGALLLTHYWALWLVAATVVVLGWRAWRVAEERKVTVRALLAVVAGGLFLLPWLPSMLYQSAHTGTPWGAVVRPTTMAASTLRDFGGAGSDNSEALLLGGALLALFLLGLFATRIDDRRLVIDVRTLPQVRREAAVVGLTVAIACSAGYLTRTTFATRYTAVIFPLFFVVAAVGLTRLDMPIVRQVVVVALVALGLVGGVNNVVTDRTQAGDIAAAMSPELQRGDLVVMCPDQLGPSTHRVLPSSTAQVTYPTFGSPDRVDWRDYEERNAQADPKAFASGVVDRAHAAGAHSVWLVSSGSYKTLEGQCEALTTELGTLLGSGTLEVAENGDSFFEHAALVRFPGPAAT
ncbi:MAG TPA: glycosyltransferase family 39 protein [Acidimicrobiales bacterium]|nr:glycosyltransferase family 39 protein [Acidimicrobiales bacterium]